MQLDQAHGDKTTFTSHCGSFRYKRMPFGLLNAPAMFQLGLYIILTLVQCKTFLAYLYDLIIFSSYMEEHVQPVDDVLTVIGSAVILLKLLKCESFQQGQLLRQLPVIGGTSNHVWCHPRRQRRFLLPVHFTTSILPPGMQCLSPIHI